MLKNLSVTKGWWPHPWPPPATVCDRSSLWFPFVSPVFVPILVRLPVSRRLWTPVAGRRPFCCQGTRRSGEVTVLTHWLWKRRQEYADSGTAIYVFTRACISLKWQLTVCSMALILWALWPREIRTVIAQVSSFLVRPWKVCRFIIAISLRSCLFSCLFHFICLHVSMFCSCLFYLLVRTFYLIFCLHDTFICVRYSNIYKIYCDLLFHFLTWIMIN